MEPEIVTPAPAGNKKKYFLVAIVIVLAIAGATYWFLFMQKETSMPVSPVVTEEKVYTQEEKLKLLADLASSTPKATPAQTAEGLRLLQALASSTKQ